MSNSDFHKLIDFVRDQYKSHSFIPLHEPVFEGREAELVSETIASSFVSSVGEYVTKFEKNVASYTASPSAVATVTGTAALHVSLKLAGVMPEDFVITQPLTFIATCNAIAYCNAEPVFVDVDPKTLSLSPNALQEWLINNAHLGEDGVCRDRETGRVIRACVIMHTFGHPAKLPELLAICNDWQIMLVEDAAEALGSTIRGVHTGTFGLCGALSFNGNKIITTGGGGMILTNNRLGIRARHLTTTAKRPHAFEFYHDEIGFNYRLPNINAALGCAQLESIELFISLKRKLAKKYAEFFKDSDLEFFNEPKDCRSNFWLNAVICNDQRQRDALLKATNENEVMTRPVWSLMNKLPMFKNCKKGPLNQAEWLAKRIVNLPSSVTKSVNS